MQLALDLSPNNGRPLQMQIFEGVESLILSGRLRGGEPVPSSRTLSGMLRVARNTVVIAYEKLHAEGYIESRKGVGTFVCARIPAMAPRLSAMPAPAGPPVNGAAAAIPGPKAVQRVMPPGDVRLDADFWVGRSDPGSFPLREWRRVVGAKLITAGAAVSDYPDPLGVAALRAAIADHVGPARGIGARPEDVLVTCGIQDAMTMIALALRDRACCFAHEDPCYEGARFLFESLGYDCRPVPVDRDGLEVGLLPCDGRAVLYLTPSHQFPLGVQLSFERRLALLDWAERTDSYIIEDDYNGDFRYEGATLPALRGLDQRGRVIYLGTFSKAFGPGLRLGFMVMPPPLARALSRWKALCSNGAAWLEQAAVAEFLASGRYRRHLRRLRATCLRRRDAMIAALTAGFGDGIEIRGRRGGAHLSVVLPDNGVDLAALLRRARAERIGAYDIDTCGAFTVAPRPCVRRALILGYGAVPEERIAPALQRLAALAAGLARGS